MKQFTFFKIILPVIFSLMSLISFSQASKDSVLKETLVNLEKQSWVAWQNHDSTFFRNFLSDDHIEMGFGGPGNKNMVVKSVGSPLCTVKNYTVDKFRVFLLDANTALVTYHAAQETTCNGNAVPSPVWVSSLYQIRNGKWQNVLYQQTQTNK